jgi:hypothetical protein
MTEFLTSTRRVRANDGTEKLATLILSMFVDSDEVTYNVVDDSGTVLVAYTNDSLYHQVWLNLLDMGFTALSRV